MLAMTLLILALEVFYYSLFMRNAKREGSIFKYILLFILETIIITLLSSKQLPTYLIFVLLTYVGLRYFVKVKVSLYDMLTIVIMLFLKVAMELPFYYLFVNIMNRYAISILVGITKVVLVLIFSNFIKNTYKKFKVKWDENNFFIRYIFSILVFAYCIITAILFIIK